MLCLVQKLTVKAEERLFHLQDNISNREIGVGRQIEQIAETRLTKPKYICRYFGPSDQDIVPVSVKNHYRCYNVMSMVTCHAAIVHFGYN